jgi:hypothetical protein
MTEYHGVIMEVDSKTYRFCTAWLSACGTHQIKNLVTHSTWVVNLYQLQSIQDDLNFLATNKLISSMH